MKTVLIPTDFNVKSLSIIDTLVMTSRPETISVIFVHAFKLSDSISDMLMLSRRSRDYENIDQAFYNQLNHYKQKYPNDIQYIGIEYFYGSTVVAFKNFLSRIEPSFIAYPKNYQFNPINKYSIDPVHLTNHCGCTVLTLDADEFTQAEKLFDTKIPEKATPILST